MFWRILILAAVAYFGYRYVRRIISAFLPPRPRHEIHEGHGPNGALFSGEMVRDTVCKAFVAKERALTAQKGGETHYFCSDACRRKFLEGE